MMRAISFSLFGTEPIYLHGALRNAEVAPQFYKGWTCVFYVETESVTLKTIGELIARGAEVRPYSRFEYPNGMFSRFLIADDPNVERFVIRDVDSRPSQREVNAVEAWVKSDLNFHAMRDHPWHQSRLMGGLWGAKGGVLRNVEQAINSFKRSRHPYSRETQYGADQEFLVNFVYPKVCQSGVIHDSCCRHIFRDGVDFPDPLVEGDFVGSIYDENEQPNAEHIKVRNDWIRGIR